MIMADAAAATQAMLVMVFTADQHLCEGACGCRQGIAGVVSIRMKPENTQSGHVSAFSIYLQVEFAIICHRYSLQSHNIS